MSGRIFQLLTRHQRLDEALRMELSHRWPDPVRALQLKKLKLAIKEKLHRLSQRRDTRTA